MSKRIITLLFTALSSVSFAQDVEGLVYKHFASRTSPHAQYLRFSYQYNNLPILEHQRLEIKTLSGEHIKTKSSLEEDALSALNSDLSGPHLLWRNNAWLSVRADTTNNGVDHYVRYYSASNELVDEIDLNLHLNDTTILVRVFNPDPLSPNNLIYGGAYTDMNDGNANVLDSLTILDMVTLDVINDTVRLQNSYLKVLDFDAPYISISTDPSKWLSGRASDEFEQVMVAYHITKQNEYLNALGYGDVLNYAIHVDPQALNGQDNSMFNWGTSPPRLFFGEGGVDDAEDADVIIHELGHAISYGAAPASINGDERRTFDEALGDYFAERYGRLSGVQSTRIFDWDGNNTFWNGRSAIYDGNKNYNSITNYWNIYQHTDLMVSAMLEFSADPTVKDTIADQIILESLYQLMSYQSLRDIAKNILSADSLVNNAAYSAAIYQAFGTPKNILAPMGSATIRANEDLPYISFEQSPKVILPSDEIFKFTTFELSGRLLRQGSASGMLPIEKAEHIIHLTGTSGITVVLKKP